LRKKFNAEIEYVPGDGGVYEIVADGREVFVKAKEKRFPDEGEIVTRLEGLS